MTRYAFVLILLIVLLTSGMLPALSSEALPNQINALLILPQNYGANYYLNRINMERLGWDITLTGVNETITPCSTFAGPHGCEPLNVDVLLTDIEDVTAYDVVAIMPASKYYYDALLASETALDLIRTAHDAGKVVFAACGGVRVLAAAGILQDHTVTGALEFQSECEDAGASYVPSGFPPVVDGNLVTATRGMYYHINNIEAIANAVEWTRETPELEPVSVATQMMMTEQEAALWAVALGGEHGDGANAIVSTDDGGLLVAGYTFSFGAGMADIYVVKTDATGNEQWSRVYGGPGWEYAHDVASTDDGGYIVTGYTSEGAKDVLVVKLDADGEVVWSQTYGGDGVDVGMSVAQVADGGYLVTGYTTSFGAGQDDVYVLRLDAEGNTVWTQTLGGDGPEKGQSGMQTDDGGYIVVGATGTFGSGNQDIYLIKLNATGEESWTQTYGHRRSAHPYDWGTTVRQTSDGGYIIAGHRDRYTLMSALLIKTDADGEKQWEYYSSHGLYNYAYDVREMANGEYVLVGATTEAATGQTDLLVVGIDANGERLWKHILGAAGTDIASTLTLTNDGQIIVVGQSNSFGIGGFDVWLMEVRPQ